MNLGGDVLARGSRSVAVAVRGIGSPAAAYVVDVERGRALLHDHVPDSAGHKLGAKARYYRCDPSRGWIPDIDHLSTLVTANTRAVVVIDPNNPTGATYPVEARRALLALKLGEIQSNGYSFQIELNHRLWRQGYKLVEVPIIFTERLQGHSKMSGHIIREALIMVWKLWFQNGLRRSPRV